MALTFVNHSPNTPGASSPAAMLLAQRAGGLPGGAVAPSGGAAGTGGMLGVGFVQGRTFSQAEQEAMQALGVLREASAALHSVASGLQRAAELAARASEGPDASLDQALHQVLGELEPLVQGTHTAGAVALDGTTLAVELVHGSQAFAPVTTLTITLPDIAGTLFGEGGLDELRLDVPGGGSQAKQAVAAALSEVDIGQRQLRAASGQLTTALAQLGAGRGAQVEPGHGAALAAQSAARLRREIVSAPGLALRAQGNASALARALLERS